MGNSHKNLGKKKLKESKNPVFGVEIDEVIQRPSESKKLPMGIIVIFNHLENKAPSCEGIFRKPGRMETIEALRNAIDHGDLDFVQNCKDIYSIGACLKDYVRSLPSSLCDLDEFLKVLDVGKDDPSLGEQELRNLLEKLTEGKRNLLFKLLNLLAMVANASDITKMTVQNLSLVWALNIMKKKDLDPIELIDLTPKVNKVCGMMIKLYTQT